MKLKRIWLFISITVLILIGFRAGSPGPAASAPAPFKAVFVSLDGFPADLLDQGLVKRYMPNLSALLRGGAVAARATSTFPSITPCGHAALWTGAYGGVSGITASRLRLLPRQEFTILESIDGFSSEVLEAEPIFVTAARQGLKTLVLGATHTYPFFRYFDQNNWGLSTQERERMRENIKIFELYAGKLGQEQVVSRQELQVVAPAQLPAKIPRQEVLGFTRTFMLAMTRESYASPLYSRFARARLEGYWYRSSKRSRKLDRLLLSLTVSPQSGAGENRADDDSRTYHLDIKADSREFHNLSFQFFQVPAAMVFRLFAASPDGRDFLFYAAPAQAFLASSPREVELFSRLGGIYGNGASQAFKQGRLGAPLTQGGNGMAEQRYTETVLELVARLEKLWQLTSKEEPWNLACAYLPYPDEALHLWYGRLQASRSGSEKVQAEKLEGYLGQILKALDRYLGTLLKGLGPRGYLILTSDHGMRPTTRTFYPNRLLLQKGLLAVDERGQIDLEKTRAYYAGSFSVLINRADRSKGVVPPAQVPGLSGEIARLLRQVRDPETGGPVVSRVIEIGDPEAATWGVGNPRSGDLLLDLNPPYYYSSAYTPGPLTASMVPAGSHGFHPEAPDMHALMILRGPGVEHLRRSSRPVRHIQAAPTLCDWLGIEPPRHSAGTSLTESKRDLQTAGGAVESDPF